MAPRICLFGFVLLLVGCAPIPQKPELTAEQIEELEEIRRLRQQERELLAKKDVEDALKYMEWVCSHPPGPQREAEMKKAVEEYNWRAACPDQPQSQPQQ